MCKKMIIYLFQLVIPLYIPLRPLKGQGHISRSRSHIKVKVKSGQHQIEVIFKERYSNAGGLHLNQMRSCLMIL